ncbi:hypothetical protein ACU686_00845 [Yinghuangia aomiensis]
MRVPGGPAEVTYLTRKAERQSSDHRQARDHQHQRQREQHPPKACADPTCGTGPPRHRAGAEADFRSARHLHGGDAAAGQQFDYLPPGAAGVPIRRTPGS